MDTYKNETPEIKLRKKNGQLISTKITSAKAAERFFREIFDAEQLDVREQAMAVFLDASNQTIGYFLVSVGGITATIIDQRLLFRAAIECGATSFLLAHNHPSGSLEPSDNDIELTKKLVSGGKILGIKFLDHLILTTNRYTSLNDEGLITQLNSN
jgi:DNA repair protein RadC